MQEGAIYKSQSASQPVSGWASGLEEGTCQPGKFGIKTNLTNKGGSGQSDKTEGGGKSCV
jgi:hypothetical protein